MSVRPRSASSKNSIINSSSNVHSIKTKTSHKAQTAIKAALLNFYKKQPEWSTIKKRFSNISKDISLKKDIAKAKLNAKAKNISIYLDNIEENLTKDYCNQTNSGVDELFDSLKTYGLGYQDIMHIEYLSDPNVLNIMPEYGKRLKKNNPDDVGNYLLAFAKQLERELTLTK